MFFCYIIYSPQLDSYYTGSCADFDLRLKAHNSKKYVASYTSKSDDWKRFLVIQTETSMLFDSNVKLNKWKAEFSLKIWKNIQN